MEGMGKCDGMTTQKMIVVPPSDPMLTGQVTSVSLHYVFVR